MQITEVDYSTIKPGVVEKKSVPISDIEELLIKSAGEKILPYINTYNKYSAASNSAVIRDFLKNLEEYYKNKNIDDANKKIIISKVFDTLKSQFSILESLQIENDSSELLIMLFSTIFSHFKKFSN